MTALLEAAANPKKPSDRVATPSSRLRARLLGSLVARGGFTYNGRSYLIVGAKKKSRPRRRLAESAAAAPSPALRLLLPSEHDRLLDDVLASGSHADSDAPRVRGSAHRVPGDLIEAARLTQQDAAQRAASRYFSRAGRDERVAATMAELFGPTPTGA